MRTAIGKYHWHARKHGLHHRDAETFVDGRIHVDIQGNEIIADAIRIAEKMHSFAHAQLRRQRFEISAQWTVANYYQGDIRQPLCLVKGSGRRTGIGDLSLRRWQAHSGETARQALAIDRAGMFIVYEGDAHEPRRGTTHDQR